MVALRYLVLAAACATWPNLACAQCRLCQHPVTASSAPSPSRDVELQIETDLNFDRMILAGEGIGAATIRPDGSSGVEGSVIQLGPRAMVGTVLAHGEPNRAVRIEIPRRIQLISLNGGQITLDDVTTDVPAVSHLDAAGNMSFRFGGKIVLYVESDGPYSGDLPITVAYQ